jgi:hypothetical protein
MTGEEKDRSGGAAAGAAFPGGGVVIKFRWTFMLTMESAGAFLNKTTLFGRAKAADSLLGIAATP